MSKVAEQKLPQMQGIFCQIGQHDQHPWKPMPWRGIYNKVLYFDHITGATMELAKIEKGAKFPSHYHTTVQTLFLVSGRLRDDDGEITEPGTFRIIPAGQLHGPFTAEEETIQFKYFSGAPVYILQDGATYIYRFNGEMVNAGVLEFARALKDRNFISPSK
jgi:quercetin dioxygenase-like cupin family protein